MISYSRPLTPSEQQTLARLSDITWRAAELLQRIRDERAGGVATAPRIIANKKTPHQRELIRRPNSRRS